ncbi:MAG: hydrogenase maturation nickel metallochaperone HypA [Erysipelotrichaceae bacterium]
MHELGIVKHVISLVLETVEENNLTNVGSVVLRVGKVSGIVPSYLIDCWDWAVKKEKYITNSELIIEDIDAITYCEDCQKTYDTIEYGKKCPNCGSENTYLKTGDECYILQIEAE